MSPSTPPHLVFLFSDTGGGHRSAAQALTGALECVYPGGVTCELVEIFRGAAPPPLDRLPDLYPALSSRPGLLGAIFAASDGPRRLRAIRWLIWPYVRPSLERLLVAHPADLYVSVHPLINIPLGCFLERAPRPMPFATVVTDLVTAHTSWFDPRASRIIVPTEDARQVGLRCGVDPQRLAVAGLPVAQEIGDWQGDPCTVRDRLGWPPEGPVVLLMGGGEGVGHLEAIAYAIDRARLPLTLVIVAGRNQVLRARLEARAWGIPVRVYGFIRDVPDFMHAATVLLTKAGPGTISEALCAGLPSILYSKLNGPEDGNVRYLVDSGAGIWAPGVEQAVAALQRWLDHPDERDLAAQACRSLARPHAASAIAGLLMEMV